MAKKRKPDKKPDPMKPTLTLLPHLSELTPEDVEAFFEKLTGRKVTAEEAKELRDGWDDVVE